MVGVEGTGTYGLGLQRVLQQAGLKVIEVNRPNRQLRRTRGKSDTVDAEAAARAVLAGHATVVPKARDGIVESIRVLRIARESSRRSRTRVGAQIRHLVLTAPERLHLELAPLPLTRASRSSSPVPARGRHRRRARRDPGCTAGPGPAVPVPDR